MGMQESSGIFSTERQDGVHYITDYYSLLGVARDADTAVIRSAYLQKSREYHPDRVAGLAPEFQNKANFLMPKINKAREALEDPERRTAYDALLQAWDGPISEDGYAVIDMNIPFYGMETSEAAMQFAASVAEQAKVMIGQSDDTLKLIEGLYERRGGSDEAIEAMYEEALEKKQNQLAVEEDELRGVMRIPITSNASPPLEYLAAAEAAVNTRRVSFERQVEARLALVQSGEIPLLEDEKHTVESEKDKEAPGLGIDVVRNNMLASYDSQAAKILKLAQEREEVIKKRLELVRGRYIGEQPQFHDHLLVRMILGEKILWFGFSLQGESVVQLDKDYTHMSVLQNADELKKSAMAFYADGTNVMTVVHKEGLPAHEVLYEAVGKHYDTYMQNSEEADVEAQN